MSEASDFRGWAARIARQAGQERDAKEARRLMSIAEYWGKACRDGRLAARHADQ